MNFLFRYETLFYMIKLLATDTWMCLQHGEGEKEIENHGRSRVKSFSQETGAIDQQASRNDVNGLKLKSLKCRMHDDSPTQLPSFFFFKTNRKQQRKNYHQASFQ